MLSCIIYEYSLWIKTRSSAVSLRYQIIIASYDLYISIWEIYILMLYFVKDSLSC